MFKSIGNFMTLMKQAQSIGGKMQGVNDELKSSRATGSAGGGMVEIEVNGLGEVLRCRIEQSLVDKGDREMLEDLIAAAANDASQKARGLHMEAMKGLAEGVELPGLDEALSKLTGGEGGIEEIMEEVIDAEIEEEDDKPQSGTA